MSNTSLKKHLKRGLLGFFTHLESSPRRHGDIVVTLYHDVGEQASAYGISRTVFSAQMRYLLERNTRWQTATSAADQLYQEGDNERVCVTFDDGDRSAFRPTMDLVEAGGKCTHFIIPERINRKDRRTMSWAQVAELDRAGVEIGSHSMTHAWLTRLSDRDLSAELSDSKSAIEDKLGKPVTAFAYPYGDLDRRVVDRVRECGYRCAFTTRHLYAAGHDDEFRIPRFEPLASVQELVDLHQGRGHRFYRVLRFCLKTRDRIRF